MTALRQMSSDYLSLRRAMGFKLERAEKLLAQFLDFLQARDAHTITIEHALAWAMLPGGGQSWAAQRMSVVRGFAAFVHTIDSATEVPPSDLLPNPPHRATPFLYSDEQIAALIDAANTLGSPARIATYQTLIGLLSVSGLRIGEALRLDRSDINLTHNLLVVRDTKFGKSREIPLHPTTASALDAYLHRSDRPTLDASPAVFVSTVGTRLLYGSVHPVFRSLVRLAGIEVRSARCRPRLHDLRHTFAVRTVLDGYRTDGDLQRRLSLLATYLGHANPDATYWYLSAAPELMALAGERLERHLGDRP